MPSNVTVTQADKQFAADWNFECRHCSEYEGDFEADLAVAVAKYREQATRDCGRCAEEWSAYMDEAVSKAPEPLRALGEYLTSLLDENEWKSAERYLNAAALTHPPAQDVAALVELADALACVLDDSHSYESEGMARDYARKVLDKYRTALAKHERTPHDD